LLQEFEVNVHRDKLRELHLLKQMDSVEEYKRKFDQLAYHIKIYDPAVGGVDVGKSIYYGAQTGIKGSCGNTVVRYSSSSSSVCNDSGSRFW
jgi:hypothetical protein